MGINTLNTYGIRTVPNNLEPNPTFATLPNGHLCEDPSFTCEMMDGFHLHYHCQQRHKLKKLMFK